MEKIEIKKKYSCFAKNYFKKCLVSKTNLSKKWKIFPLFWQIIYLKSKSGQNLKNWQKFFSFLIIFSKKIFQKIFKNFSKNFSNNFSKKIFKKIFKKFFKKIFKKNLHWLALACTGLQKHASSKLMFEKSPINLTIW